MKTTKIIFLISAFLLMVSILASCGTKELQFNEVYKTGQTEVNEPLLNKISNWSIQENWNYDYSFGEYVVFYENVDKEQKRYVYSLVKDETVIVVPTESSIAYRASSDVNGNSVALVSVKCGEDYTTYLLDSKGAVKETADSFITFSDYSYSPDSCLTKLGEFFSFDDKIYYFDADDNITLLCDVPSFFSLNYLSNAKMCGDYIVSVQSKSVSYYDKALNYISRHTVPSYASPSFFLLGNGNLLVQYTIQVDSYSDDYHILVDSQNKTKLVQYVYDIKSKSAYDVDLGGYVQNLQTVEENNRFINYDKIPNVAIIAPIQNYKMNTTASALYAVDDYGNIVANFPNILNNPALANPIGGDYFLAESFDGEKAILDPTGKVLRYVTSSDVERYDFGFVSFDSSGYIEEVYNDEFEMIFSSEDKHILIYDYYYIIYREDDGDDGYKYFRFDKNGNKTISNLGDWEVNNITRNSSGIYVIEYRHDYNTSTAIYAADGKVLVERSTYYKSIYITTEDVVIIRVQNEEDYDYYRVTK